MLELIPVNDNIFVSTRYEKWVKCVWLLEHMSMIERSRRHERYSVKRIDARDVDVSDIAEDLYTDRVQGPNIVPEGKVVLINGSLIAKGIRENIAMLHGQGFKNGLQLPKHSSLYLPAVLTLVHCAIEKERLEAAGYRSPMWSTAGFAISTLGKTITRTNGFPLGRSIQRGDKVMPV